MKVGRLLPGFIKRPLHDLATRYVLPAALRVAGGDSLELVHRRVGIGNYETPEISGEVFLINQVLPALLDAGNSTLFDVGAHNGSYARALFSRFPKARIFAFEPMPRTFESLERELASTSVQCHAIGLSDCEGTAPIYDYSGTSGSEHASLYEKVLEDIHHASAFHETRVQLQSIDGFCKKQQIAKIDFLKIDTEGNELKVLNGADWMIDQHAIRSIQFEFNEMNVVSRVFLRDFYDKLKGFAFYRLLSNGLLPLGNYSPRNEIFSFQNIIAIDTRHLEESRIQPFVIR